jgi:hypothetical protein
MSCIDLLWCCAAQTHVRAVPVVPIEKQKNLPAKPSPRKRHDWLQLKAGSLERAYEPFAYGDATSLADGPLRWRMPRRLHQVPKWAQVNWVPESLMRYLGAAPTCAINGRGTCGVIRQDILQFCARIIAT